MNDLQCDNLQCEGVASREDVTAGGEGEGGSQRDREGEPGEKGFWVCVPRPWGLLGHFY